jgi:hypothetical protein
MSVTLPAQRIEKACLFERQRPAQVPPRLGRKVVRKQCHACKAKQKQIVGGYLRGFLRNKHDQGAEKADKSGDREGPTDQDGNAAK